MLGINSAEAQRIILGWTIVQIKRYSIINAAAHSYLKCISDPVVWFDSFKIQVRTVLHTTVLWPMATPLHRRKPFLSTAGPFKIAFCNIQNLFSLNSNARIALSFRQPNGKVNTWMAFEHLKWTCWSTFPSRNAHVLWKENITLKRNALDILDLVNRPSTASRWLKRMFLMG